MNKIKFRLSFDECEKALSTVKTVAEWNEMRATIISTYEGHYRELHALLFRIDANGLIVKVLGPDPEPDWKKALRVKAEEKANTKTVLVVGDGTADVVKRIKSTFQNMANMLGRMVEKDDLALTEENLTPTQFNGILKNGVPADVIGLESSAEEVKERLKTLYPEKINLIEVLGDAIEVLENDEFDVDDWMLERNKNSPLMEVNMEGRYVGMDVGSGEDLTAVTVFKKVDDDYVQISATKEQNPDTLKALVEEVVKPKRKPAKKQPKIDEVEEKPKRKVKAKQPAADESEAIKPANKKRTSKKASDPNQS